jgi:protein SCO1
MAGPAMNKTLLIALSIALLLAGCNRESAQPPLSSAPLAGAAIGGDFSLTDQDGKKRTWEEFDGKYRIVYFGYTNCPDICTPDMQNLMLGLKAFEKAKPDLAAKIQPIFITVDPKRDTPEVLKQFVSAFHPRAIGQPYRGLFARKLFDEPQPNALSDGTRWQAAGYFACGPAEDRS